MKHEEHEKRRFKMADRVHYARGRALENRAVSKNLDKKRVFRGDQSSVWDDIEMKSMRLEARSHTSASDEMYVSSASKIKRFVKSFQQAPSQAGSIFVVNDEVAGLEVFASDVTHQQMLPRLIRSYALDAIDPRANQSKRSVDSKKPNLDHTKRKGSEFLKRIENAWIKEFDGICLGKNLRIKDTNITGGALVQNDRVLHLSTLAV